MPSAFRFRITGQIRPTSYETERGETRYAVEFVVGPFGDFEVLARGKARDPASDAEHQPAA